MVDSKCKITRIKKNKGLKRINSFFIKRGSSFDLNSKSVGSSTLLGMPNNISFFKGVGSEDFLLKLEYFFSKARSLDKFINCLPFLEYCDKPYYSWYRSKRTKIFLGAFYIIKSLTEDKAIIKDIGARNKYVAIWVHPKIFIQMVQSIIPRYEVLVTDWVFKKRTLAMKEELVNERAARKKLAMKHRVVLRKRVHHKLGRGCCVYLRTTDYSRLVFKVGSSKDINRIMADARRHFSKSLLVYCVYLNEDHYKLFEKCLLIKWERFLVSLNHEQLAGISLDRATLEMDQVLSSLGMPHTKASAGCLGKLNEGVLLDE